MQLIYMYRFMVNTNGTRFWTHKENVQLAICYKMRIIWIRHEGWMVTLKIAHHFKFGFSSAHGR